jgi:acetyl-CoA carboxylase biotin carboxyl carrier protein
MTVKDIKELIKLIDEYKLAEFKLEDGELKLTIRSNTYSKEQTVIAQAPIMAAAPTPAAAPAISQTSAPAPSDSAGSDGTENLLEVKSPIVGTFYRSSNPDKPPFVKVGDTINEGDVVCVVEAMKLFNEIESEVSGKIVKVLLEDASPVEYDQVLFLVDPNG